MKFLTLAILVASTLLVDTSYGDDPGNYDLGKIVTTEGTTYRNIYILDGDTFGLMFRHEEGIAKVPYYRLSDNLRMLYEPTGEIEAEEGDAQTEPQETAAAEPGNRPLIYTVWTRTSSPPDYLSLGGAYPYTCHPLGWRSHWPRYSPVHSLVNPYCRERVTRDFLYTTGLIPKPPGVFTYHLPRARPVPFY